MGLFSGIKKAWHNHFLMMALCCAVPLVLVAALYAPGFSSYSFWLLLLLCPVMHFVMMKGIGARDRNGIEQKGAGGEKCH